MSKHDLLLRNFKPRSALESEINIPENARFPVIDAHNHLSKEIGGRISSSLSQIFIEQEKMVDLMDQLNIHCVVNLDGGWGDQLKRNIEIFKSKYPERFCVFTWVNWAEVDESNFGSKWAKELSKSVAAGAQGLKVFKKLGLYYRDSNGKLIKPDDPRLYPIWAQAGELGIPILIHTADPVAFFWPLDEYNERWDELHEHPDWHFYGQDYPSFKELIESQQNLIEQHPNTTFISAHVLSYSENMRYVANALDKYPNLYVDIGERIGEIGRQPYTSKWFLTQYDDRILFGTDIPPNKSTYQTYFRCLETHDEYFDYGRMQGRYHIYGLSLSDETLQKIYLENSLKIIPGMTRPKK
ncbi:amidohydrolase family protein [Candidatus Bathyarchaeota archaeon]|nr:amidohydrolase family protein [Candidatus Bathyarchaeota archaeon]